MTDKLVRILEEKVNEGTIEELCGNRDIEIENALVDHLEEVAIGLIEAHIDDFFYECLFRVIERYPIDDDIIDYSRELIYERLESYIKDKIRELMEE